MTMAAISSGAVFHNKRFLLYGPVRYKPLSTIPLSLVFRKKPQGVRGEIYQERFPGDPKANLTLSAFYVRNLFNLKEL
jgi:hypothetical protein